MLAARCAMEWVLRHEPQRAAEVQRAHALVRMYAAQLQDEPHDEHEPPWALARVLVERPRLRLRAESADGASWIMMRVMVANERGSAKKVARWAQAVAARPCVPRRKSMRRSYCAGSRATKHKDSPRI